MKRRYALLGVMAIIILLTSCKSNPTEVIPEKEIEPGRRDYVWDETLLPYPQYESGVLWSIWGTSPLNVWAVGSCNAGPLGVWYFNGINWANIRNTETFRQSSVWGSAENDVWIGSASGTIWHYNGADWNYYTQLKFGIYPQFAIQRLWGLSATEIYAVGCKLPGTVDDKTIGSVFKYDGFNWKRLNIPDSELNFFDVLKDKDGDLIIEAMNSFNFQESILVWDGVSLRELLPPAPLGHTSMSFENGNVYVLRDELLYKYDSKSLKLLKNILGLGSGAIKSMRSEKDIFFSNGKEGKHFISHYNGTDLQLIYETGTNFAGKTSYIFEKDVFFILGDDRNFTTKILHGRLKE